MSLYNDLRPTTISEVVGQDNVKAQLRGIIESGNIPNAMLLTGPRGTGKTTIARIIARQLNCENGGAEPCGKCDSCKSILNGSSMDVVELDAASNNKVEDVRYIIEKAQFAPMSKYKIFILDEVHMFSQGAWNALLKLIEEPPKNVLFLLCTTEEHKVPATIISRCRKLYFEKIPMATVTDYLASICDKHGKAYEIDALKLCAQSSEGCMRDALSIMEPFFDADSLTTEVVANTLGAAQETAVFGILSAISEGNATLAIQIVREQAQRGKNSQLLVKALIGAITDTMFVLNGTDVNSIVNTQAYKEELEKYSLKTSVDKCLELSKVLTEDYGAISKVPDALFLIESSLVRVVDFESRVSKLERRVAALEESGVVGKVEHVETMHDIDNIVSFPQENTEKAISDVETSPVLDITTGDVDSFIENTSVDVHVEEVSPMDLSVDNSIFNGISEDEIPSDFFNNVNTETAPSDSREDSVSELNNRGFEPIADIDDDLLSHLPQGTICAGTLTETNNVEETTATEKTTVGETKSDKNIDDSISFGFEGFADFL